MYVLSLREEYAVEVVFASLDLVSLLYFHSLGESAMHYWLELKITLAYNVHKYDSVLLRSTLSLETIVY